MWVTGAAVLVAGWYLFFSATRLDRFHGRVEGARSALDAQLVRRASVSFQLAVSGLFDPATSLLLADDGRRAALREAGSRWVRRYDWETVASDLVAVYETVEAGAGAVIEDERRGWRDRLRR